MSKGRNGSRVCDFSSSTSVRRRCTCTCAVERSREVDKDIVISRFEEQACEADKKILLEMRQKFSHFKILPMPFTDIFASAFIQGPPLLLLPSLGESEPNTSTEAVKQGITGNFKIGQGYFR